MTTTLPGQPEGADGGPAGAGSDDEDTSAVELLLAPREGVPPVIASGAALAEVVERFAGGTGPVAVDAERASGYRYSQRAYLVQLRRHGAGTALIDPIACPDLSELSEVLSDAEWVLHAASQDLACLAEVGMVPERVFDTELAGRLAGFERVGLGAMVENVLGLRLEKGHSAADWSTRPLPEAWLVYAALDVEVLVELRDALEEELRAQGKLAWAHEEFEAVRTAPPPPPRIDPWRRTSGIHRLRTRRQLAAVRAMWEVRDTMARRRDTAPGRILPDAAIVAAVSAAPRTPAELMALPVFGGRATRRHVDTWFAALAGAAALPDSALPQPLPPGDGPPPANRWAERDPVAARRLARVRAVVADRAAELAMPPENLVQPEAVRRLAWTPPDPVDEDSVAASLRASGARAWQVAQLAAALAAVLPDPEPDPETDRGRGERPTADRIAAERPTGDRPTGDRTAVDRTAADRGTDDRPTGDRATDLGGEDADADRARSRRTRRRAVAPTEDRESLREAAATAGGASRRTRPAGRTGGTATAADAAEPATAEAGLGPAGAPPDASPASPASPAPTATATAGAPEPSAPAAGTVPAEGGTRARRPAGRRRATRPTAPPRPAEPPHHATPPQPAASPQPEPPQPEPPSPASPPPSARRPPRDPAGAPADPPPPTAPPFSG